MFKKLHRCAFALLNNQEVGESIDGPGHRAGALKPPHAERNCIGFRETAFQKGGGGEMKDKKKKLKTQERRWKSKRQGTVGAARQDRRD